MDLVDRVSKYGRWVDGNEHLPERTPPRPSKTFIAF